MVVKAEIIKQSKSTFSMSLRYGKGKNAKEAISLNSEEARDPSKLLRLMTKLHYTFSDSCPKGIYLFSLDTKRQVFNLNEHVQTENIVLMGVNETSIKDIVDVLDEIQDSLNFFSKSKLIVRIDKDQRPRIYTKKMRGELIKLAGEDVA